MTPATISLLERLAPAADAGGDGQPARRWLETHGLPSGREEAWRYTPVGDIKSALDDVGAAADAAVSGADVDALAGHLGGVRLVFVNGILAPELSSGPTGPPGVCCGRAPTGRGATGGDQVPRYDGFQALNELARTDVALVRVDPGTTVGEPIHIVHLAASGGGPAVSQPRTLIEVGDGGELTVVETYVGTGPGAVTNASTHITLGAGAVVAHHRIQDEPARATHVGHTRVVQGADSQLRSLSVMLGASIARHAMDVTLLGPRARVDLDGVYLPAGDQRHDNVVTVDHTAPGCTSVQRFKGVVAGRARGSFGGHVIVRPGADGTDARQTNRNLLLSSTAQADTRPWLEIFADDVRCNHGATVGRLDEDALFYLRSRGIPLDEARAMLVAAFVAEITDEVVPASLRSHLEAAVATRIGGRA
jgi:Fe-S cluster assembly protein SufD